MDFNATIDLIIKDLDEAREIIDDLKKYPGVPAFQVELAKSKCKSAGEVIAHLKSMRDNIPSYQQPQLAEEKKTEEISGKVNPIPDEKKRESVHVENSSPPVIKKETSKKIPEKEHEPPIIADKFIHLPSRFDELSGNLKSDDDQNPVLKTKPITSLSEAIGVNDRFLFIREVFDGNKDAYAQAIQRLDNAESLTDARAVIMSYTGDSNENEAVKQLLDLVKRKLSSNG